MLAKKRREVEVFSISFMDCICCGFGAVLLLFILTTGQRTDFNERDLTEMRDRIARMARIVRDNDVFRWVADELRAINGNERPA